ncbi:hypothetical protein ACFFKC_12025 [Pseudoduganella danionis]|uniref:Phasin domain-containing protein n=1 Tax=Pseudoduganella danionis TaxID=1890295 RepID=A0ABW9SKW2_9BURK|nr:hypothetical protein [Pseudoduganella danionis]MTW32256.1 hypothetical protein [Pseudoduganella danionis]
MPKLPQPALPSPNYEQFITLYQQLGQHIVTAMQRLSELHLQLGRELLSDLSDNHGRWLAGKAGNPLDTSLFSPTLEPWQHYQQQLVDILSMTHSNMLQTTHEHLTALERSMEQTSKAASNPVPRASVHTTVATSATHH